MEGLFRLFPMALRRGFLRRRPALWSSRSLIRDATCYHFKRQEKIDPTLLRRVALNHPELDIDEMRSRLLEERERLQAESESSQSSRDTVVLDQTSVGRLSRMDAMQAQAMAQEEERRRQNALRRIQGALQRIDDDCFGECIECGEWIAAKRLEWDPSVLKCIDCAQ